MPRWDIAAEQFLCTVLNAACANDATSVFIQNHRYPLWAELFCGETKTKCCYEGESTVADLRERIRRMTDSEGMVHFSGVFGSKTFKVLEFSSQEQRLILMC